MNENLPIIASRHGVRYANVFLRRGRRDCILKRIQEASFYELNPLLLARTLESACARPRLFLLKALDERIAHWNKASQVLNELHVCKQSYATVAQVRACVPFAMSFLWLAPDYRSANLVSKDDFLRRLQELQLTDYVRAYASNMDLYCSGRLSR